MDFDQTAYGQADPADTPSDAVGPVLSMVEVARYWNRREGGSMRVDLAAEVAEAREARQLAVVLELLGEVSSPLAPLEVLEVGAGTDWSARALGRLGYRVERTDADPAQVSSAWLFDLVLAPQVLRALDGEAWRAAAVNLSSLVRLGGRLVVGGSEAAYRQVLEPRGFRLDRVQPLDAGSHNETGALIAWTRES
ncbi:hypothetical protein [Sporichthya sp.]|uniref:hypothetical protein n=1 Tax=Sporichthya sp. TaxID=65475 RepID=UPI00183D52A9|nr:hypothetical protein [Sporichthya sp.]MBA3743520.1 hypothetical protein [Sporichthya sp.]